MDKIKKYSLAHYVYLLPLTLICLYLVVFSFFVPMIDEDFDLYARGSSIGALINQCIGQYLNWNARIGDVLSILLSTIPRPIYNILNGLFIFAFILIIVRLCHYMTGSVTKISHYKLTALSLVVFVLALFFLPKPNEVFFWRTGSANYFYPVLLSVLYCVPLLRYINGKSLFKKPHLLKSVSYILFGIVIGHSNENVAPVLFVLFAATIIWGAYRYKKLNWVLLLASIVILAGTMLLLFGPSTQVRLEFYGQNLGDRSLFDTIKANIPTVIPDYLKYLIPSLITSSLVMALITDDKLRKRILYVLIASVILSLGSVIILLVAPYYTPRSMFFSAVVLLFPFITALSGITNKFDKHLLVLSCVVVCYFSPFLFIELSNVQSLNFEKKAWLLSIDTQLKNTGSAEVGLIETKESQLVYNGYTSQEITRIAHYLKFPESSIRLK